MPGETTQWTGKDIVRLRMLLGMSQAQLADKLGMSEPTLSMLEGGRLKPSLLDQVRLDHFRSPEPGK
jgi:transcriptional regulator with XRE-family HTH domain